MFAVLTHWLLSDVVCKGRLSVFRSPVITFIFVGLVPGQKISDPSDEINAIPGGSMHDFLHAAEYKKINFVMMELEPFLTQPAITSYSMNMLNNSVAL